MRISGVMPLVGEKRWNIAQSISARSALARSIDSSGSLLVTGKKVERRHTDAGGK